MKPFRGVIKNWHRRYYAPDQYIIVGDCDRFATGKIYTSMVVKEFQYPTEGYGECETMNSSYRLETYKEPDEYLTEHEVKYENFLRTIGALS